MPFVLVEVFRSFFLNLWQALCSLKWHNQNLMRRASQSNVCSTRETLLSYPSRIATAPLPVTSIPGPWPALPFLGTFWLYTLAGPYTLRNLHLANEDKFKKYGPVVREEALGNIPIIRLYSKSDIEQVLKASSKFPIRPILELQVHYRNGRADRYGSVGLVNAQGPEWLLLRSRLTPQITSRGWVTACLQEMNDVTEEFVELIRNQRNEEGYCLGFMEYVQRMSLEVMMAVILRKRAGFLSTSMSGEARKLISATRNLFDAFHKAMYGLPLWKYWNTRAFKDFVNSEDTLYETLVEYVKECQSTTEAGFLHDSVLTHIFALDDLDERDKVSAMVDFLTSGIDTIAYSLIFLLENVLSDQAVRQKLYQEIDQFSPCNTFITAESLQEMKYLKACVMESFRLSPIAPNIARVTEKPLVCHGYEIPAKTVVICETWVACLQDENFPQARIFNPERWINNAKRVVKNSPLLVVPFGYGKRMCPGKRLAEQELMISVIKLLKNFDLEFTGTVDTEYRFLITPVGPISLKVKDRNYC